MSERRPSEVVNLDIYGGAVISWDEVHGLLAFGPKPPEVAFFLGTVRPNGRPHVAGVGTVWHDGDLYFTGGPSTRMIQNLLENPNCTMAVKLPELDVTLEGEASRVVDSPDLETLASTYREGGWPAEVKGDAFTAPFSAPSAGSPPWYLFRFVFHTVISVRTAGSSGATRWTLT